MITLSKRFGKIADVVNVPPSRFEIWVMTTLFVIAPFGYGMFYYGHKLHGEHEQIMRTQRQTKTDIDKAVVESYARSETMTTKLSELGKDLIAIEVQQEINTKEIEKLRTRNR